MSPKWVKTANTTSVDVYHTERCKAVREGTVREIDDGEIERRDLDVCGMCSGNQRENRDAVDGDYGYYAALTDE
jgi:hypothetical protein